MSGNATWTAREQALWARIAAHAFEDDSLAQDFTRRLAREQLWSLAQARAAVDEYRRFCFLAVAAGHPVTPSREVDEVWHLHLSYTRDYWQVFCPQALGTPLHHGPTAGGAEEARRYREQYGDTLASYQRYFGPPPPACWPAAGQRFGRRQRLRRVDTERFYIVPRLHLKPRQHALIAIGLLLLVLSPLAMALPANPFDWYGPEFLLLYLALLAATLMLVIVGQGRLRDNGASRQHAPLDVWEAACLAGGSQRVLDAAAAQLISQGLARPDLLDKRLALEPGASDLPPPLRQYAALMAEPRGLELPRHRLDEATRALAQSLTRKRLLLDEETRRRVQALPLKLFGALMAFGAIKVAVGISRDKPVDWLVFLLLLTAVLTLVFWRRQDPVSRAGRQALQAYSSQHSHLKLAPNNRDLAIAVAIGAGAAAFAGTAYADMHAMRHPRGDGSSGDGGGSGGSSDSGGDAGDGGSSGCGGCGGGD